MERARIAQDIERLRRMYTYLLEEWSEARHLAASWDLEGEQLAWRIFLDDVLEPDVDVEVLERVLVVRASAAHPCQALVPVPAPFQVQRAVIRCRGGVLEIRLSEARRGG